MSEPRGYGRGTSAPGTFEPPTDLGRLQNQLARRLLLVFAIPLVVIVALAFYAYRLSVKVAEVEALERITTIERLYDRTRNISWLISEYDALAKTYRRPAVLARLGALYYQRDVAGDRQRALTVLEEARRNGEYWETYSTLTYVYLREMRKHEAVAAGRRALALNPLDAQTYNNLAWIYATSKDPGVQDLQQAEALALKALEYTRGASEGNHDYLDTLLEIYFRADKPAQGIEVATKAIQQYGSRPYLVRHLERFQAEARNGRHRNS